MSEFSPERARESAREAALEHERKLYDDYLKDLGISGDDLRGKAVADVGAGSRMFSAHVLREGLTDAMYSIEPDVKGAFPEEREQLALTLTSALKEKLDERTIEAGRESLPLADESIDVLVNHGAMPGSEWYEGQSFDIIRKEISDSFDEVIRVLKTGGVARLYPLQRYKEGWGSEWREAIEHKLEEMRRRGIGVTVEEAERYRNPDGYEMVNDRIVIRKTEMKDGG